MKAVMWTDVFQVTMMMAGLLAVLIQGSIDNGGFINIWQIAKEGGRIQFDEWDRSFRNYAPRGIWIKFVDWKK